MCSGSEARSYLRLIDFVYHSTLGLRVIQEKKSDEIKLRRFAQEPGNLSPPPLTSFFFLTLKPRVE